MVNLTSEERVRLLIGYDLDNTLHSLYIMDERRDDDKLSPNVVAALKEDIEQGTTGWVCMPKDAADLARALRDYFASPVYTNLEERRPSIRKFANEKYSWAKVGEITRRVYENACKP